MAVLMARLKRKACVQIRASPSSAHTRQPSTVYWPMVMNTLYDVVLLLSTAGIRPGLALGGPFLLEFTVFVWSTVLRDGQTPATET